MESQSLVTNKREIVVSFEERELYIFTLAFLLSVSLAVILAGETYAITYSRVSAAVRECMRVLKPGGKLLIVESTVTGWFCALERLLYPAMQLFFRICKFGCVFQFSPRSLRGLLDGVSGVQVLSGENVPIGPHIWIMGKKVPTIVTPCGATFYLLRKENAI